MCHEEVAMMESTYHFEHEGLVIDYDGAGEVATIR